MKLEVSSPFLFFFFSIIGFPAIGNVIVTMGRRGKNAGFKSVFFSLFSSNPFYKIFARYENCDCREWQDEVKLLQICEGRNHRDGMKQRWRIRAIEKEGFDRAAMMVEGWLRSVRLR